MYTFLEFPKIDEKRDFGAFLSFFIILYAAKYVNSKSTKKYTLMEFLEKSVKKRHKKSKSSSAEAEELSHEEE